MAEGEAPTRTELGREMVQHQWISAVEVHSFIALPNRKDFELIFYKECALQKFSQLFRDNEGQDFWKNWEMDSSAPEDVKLIFVKFWTGKILDADVEQYLSRFCEILQPVHKPLDQFGIWYGVRRYKVKMRKNGDGNIMQIPNSINMGPYNGKITYQGQVQRCFVCGSVEHQVKECQLVKCWKCGEFGHRGRECQNTERCNLCGADGHSFFRCPNSYSNRVRAVSRQNDEQRVEIKATEPMDRREGQVAMEQEDLEGRPDTSDDIDGRETHDDDDSTSRSQGSTTNSSFVTPNSDSEVMDDRSETARESLSGESELSKPSTSKEPGEYSSSLQSDEDYDADIIKARQGQGGLKMKRKKKKSVVNVKKKLLNTRT